MNFSVRVNAVNNAENSKVKAYADVTFAGEVKVTSITLMENANGGMFISMPRYKSSEVDEHGNTVYKDICNPITKEFRDALCSSLLEAYKESCATGQAVTRDIADIRPKEGSGLKLTAKVYPVKKEGAKSLAYAKIVIDDEFIINNVSLMEGKNGMFVAMPSYKTKNVDENDNAVYKDICYPITKECRERVRDIVLAEYKKVKEGTKEPGQSLPNADKNASAQGARTEAGEEEYMNPSVPEWANIDDELPFQSEEKSTGNKNLGRADQKHSARHENRKDRPIKLEMEHKGR